MHVLPELRRQLSEMYPTQKASIVTKYYALTKGLKGLADLWNKYITSAIIFK